MSAQPVITSSSVILVSGGARGVTAHCVLRLAERYHCKFILLGRSQLQQGEPAWAQGCADEAALNQTQMHDLKAANQPVDLVEVKKITRSLLAMREARQNLDAIRSAGAQVEYLALDVTDPALGTKLAEITSRTGAVTGIIHGAGVLADKLIEKKTAADFETVYAPKVDGLENLLLAVPPAQLSFLALFSSVAGLYGNAGQADYAIANEILSKTAHLLQRRHPDCKTLAINWGPWEGGMVTPQLKKLFGKYGVAMIPLDAGAELLIAELEGRKPAAVQVTIGKKPPRSPLKGGTPALRPLVIHRQMTLGDNPFLVDHSIGGQAVMPGTGAVSWIVSTVEQLFPAYHFFCAENFKILKGIVFNASLADDYVISLKPVEGKDLSMDVQISSKNPTGREFLHYESRVHLRQELPPAPELPLPEMGAANQQFDGAPLYLDGTLFHGPAFRGIQRVLALDENHIVARCLLPRIPETVMGQFAYGETNACIFDVVVQVALVWTQKRLGAASMPARMEKIEQYAPIPFDTPFIVTVNIYPSTTTAALRGSLVVQDERGKVLVVMTGIEGTISKELNRFFKAAGS